MPESSRCADRSRLRSSLCVAVALLGAAFLSRPVVGSSFVVPDPGSPAYRDLAVTSGSILQALTNARIEGNAHSNGSIDLASGSSVTGNASAGGQVTGAGTVGGARTGGAPPLALPQLPTEAEARALADRAFETSTTFGEVVITDVVFVRGNVRFSGNVSGTGTVIATGDIVFDHGVTLRRPSRRASAPSPPTGWRRRTVRGSR